VTIETLVGPLYLRMLLTKETLDDRVLEMIVDLVVKGIVVNGV
jgi:hypothetical protein